jgi:hypothetical protein
MVVGVKSILASTQFFSLFDPRSERLSSSCCLAVLYSRLTRRWLNITVSFCHHKSDILAKHLRAMGSFISSIANLTSNSMPKKRSENCQRKINCTGSRQMIFLLQNPRNLSMEERCKVKPLRSQVLLQFTCAGTGAPKVVLNRQIT